MNCPKCGCELDVEEIAREHGYIPVPSVEWLEQQLDKIEQMEKGHWSLVAQRLHSAMLKGEDKK